MENEMKWALLKQDGGEEEVMTIRKHWNLSCLPLPQWCIFPWLQISQRNPGLKSTLLGFIKYSNTYNPGCIHERHKKKIIFDLNDKGECELPEVIFAFLVSFHFVHSTLHTYYLVSCKIFSGSVRKGTHGEP
jgi:hypothetical protein